MLFRSLGVPTFALLYSILRDITAVKLVSRGVDENGAPLPEYMLRQPTKSGEEEAPPENGKKPLPSTPPKGRKM